MHAEESLWRRRRRNNKKKNKKGRVCGREGKEDETVEEIEQEEERGDLSVSVSVCLPVSLSLSFSLCMSLSLSLSLSLRDRKRNTLRERDTCLSLFFSLSLFLYSCRTLTQINPLTKVLRCLTLASSSVDLSNPKRFVLTNCDVPVVVDGCRRNLFLNLILRTIVREW